MKAGKLLIQLVAILKKKEYQYLLKEKFKKRKMEPQNLNCGKTASLTNLKSFLPSTVKTKCKFLCAQSNCLFINRKKEDAKFVIHKNHDLTDNYIDNLKWVNQKELTMPN